MSDEAAALISIVNDIELAREHWDTMPNWLRLLTVLRHREMAQRCSDVLGPALCRFVESSDEAPLDAMVRNVIGDSLTGQINANN